MKMSIAAKSRSGHVWIEMWLSASTSTPLTPPLGEKWWKCPCRIVAPAASAASRNARSIDPDRTGSWRPTNPPANACRRTSRHPSRRSNPSSASKIPQVGRTGCCSEFRDHPQWAECVHRVPLPTSRRPVGWTEIAHPLGPRGRNMSITRVGCKTFLPRRSNKYMGLPQGGLRAASWALVSAVSARASPNSARALLKSAVPRTGSAVSKRNKSASVPLPMPRLSFSRNDASVAYRRPARPRWQDAEHEPKLCLVQHAADRHARGSRAPSAHRARPANPSHFRESRRGPRRPPATSGRQRFDRAAGVAAPASTRAEISARRSRTSSGMSAELDSLNARSAPSRSPSRSRNVASVAPNPARAVRSAPRASISSAPDRPASADPAPSAFAPASARIGSPSGPSATSSEFSSNIAIRSVGGIVRARDRAATAAKASFRRRSLGGLVGETGFRVPQRGEDTAPVAGLPTQVGDPQP